MKKITIDSKLIEKDLCDFYEFIDLSHKSPYINGIKYIKVSEKFFGKIVDEQAYLILGDDREIGLGYTWVQPLYNISIIFDEKIKDNTIILLDTDDIILNKRINKISRIIQRNHLIGHQS